MIVRILGEGQFDVPETELAQLNELDEALTVAVRTDNEGAFEHSLAELLGRVREGGSACPDDFLGASDFVLPAAETTIQEVVALLAEDGLVPG